MNKPNNWKVCIEMGINHLGDYGQILNVLNNIKNLDVAFSLQIREEVFYEGKNKFFELSPKQYEEISSLCNKLKIPFGLALGPIKDINWIKSSNLNLNFIKYLYMSVQDKNFISEVNDFFNCPKYFSLGVSSFKEIKENIITHLREEDMLIFTSLSHDAKDQNLKEIKNLQKLTKNICFGQHCSKKEISMTAIGAGAKKLFVYTGDKSKELPDHEHAIDITAIKKYVHACYNCFEAMSFSKSEKKEQKINFIQPPSS